jgi:hypothetical protein
MFSIPFFFLFFAFSFHIFNLKEEFIVVSSPSYRFLIVFFPKQKVVTYYLCMYFSHDGVWGYTCYFRFTFYLVYAFVSPLSPLFFRFINKQKLEVNIVYTHTLQCPSSFATPRTRYLLFM